MVPVPTWRCVCGGGGGGCSGLDEEFSSCFVFVHTSLFQALWGTVNVEVLAGIGLVEFVLLTL